MSKPLIPLDSEPAVLPARSRRLSASLLVVTLACMLGLFRGVQKFVVFVRSFPRKVFRFCWHICKANVEAGFVGPLFFNDLTRLARHGRTTVLRCAYALVLLGLLCFMILNAFPQQYGQLFTSHGLALSISQWASFSRTYAIAILSVQAAAILVLTPAYLGSAIAEEKERHTAALLLTTRLSDRQFVLGKLFGRIVHLASILLAGLPILCLTRLWGGIDDNLLVAGCAVAALALLSSGGISILCSVVARRLLGAVIGAYAIVFLVNVACLALPATSPLLFVAAWDQQVQEEWRAWEEQINSTQQFLGKNSPALATVPLPPTPNAAHILLFMLAPFAIVQVSIFVLCTVTAIRVVRANCLAPGQPLLRGVPAKKAVGKGAFAPPVAKGVSNAVGDAFVTDDRRSHSTSQLLEPIGDPVLLWKEIYQAAVAGPGPGLREWRTALWRPALLLLLSVGAASGLLLWSRPDHWYVTMEFQNTLLKLLTVLLATITSGLLAFRSGACVSRERERQTLDGLLALPVDRSELLQAKWLGTLLRYRLCIYALLTVWSIGLVTGALHPLAVVFLAAVCSAHFAFLISLGLWLSLVSRNTLWAHMRLATLFLFFLCSAFLGFFDEQILNERGEAGLASWLMAIALCPERTWWLTSFSWVDSSGNLVANAAELWRAFVRAGAGTILFGGAAFLFWRLARHRLDTRTKRLKKRVQPETHEVRAPVMPALENRVC